MRRFQNILYVTRGTEDETDLKPNGFVSQVRAY
jgi:hypothetical protein